MSIFSLSSVQRMAKCISAVQRARFTLAHQIDWAHFGTSNQLNTLPHKINWMHFGRPLNRLNVCRHVAKGSNHFGSPMKCQTTTESLRICAFNLYPLPLAPINIGSHYLLWCPSQHLHLDLSANPIKLMHSSSIEYSQPRYWMHIISVLTYRTTRDLITNPSNGPGFAKANIVEVCWGPI